MTILKKLIEENPNALLLSEETIDSNYRYYIVERTQFNPSFYCGYITFPVTNELADATIGEIDAIIAVDTLIEITYKEKIENNYVIGFDCGHYRDICVASEQQAQQIEQDHKLTPQRKKPIVWTPKRVATTLRQLCHKLQQFDTKTFEVK